MNLRPFLNATSTLSLDAKGMDIHQVGLMNNNNISRISNTISNNIPNLNSLILTNNKISKLYDIENIILFKKLEHLSLLENPIVLNENYRLYIIYKMPLLKTLDYFFLYSSMTI